MQERIKKLLDQVSETDRVELIMLNNGFVAATKDHQSQNNRETLKAWRSLRSDLASFLDQLENKYQMANDETKDEIFNSKAAVHRWLEDNGWKISKTQFYDHCKESRLLPSKEDGKYRLKAVEKYARLHVSMAETGKKVNEALEAKQEKKLDIELAREEVRLEREKHDLATRQGKYINRDDHELAIVGRVVAFMAHLNHSIQQSAPDWVDLVDGDQSKVDHLVAAISQSVEQRMGDFAADIEIDVILEC
jgi:hypothetical protein